VKQSGRPIKTAERHGTIALLEVPEGLTEDYPDLVVRCRDGQAVLDRHHVVEWLDRGPRSLYVEPGEPYSDYELGEPLPGAQTWHSSEVQTFSSKPEGESDPGQPG
jgi:hypothetical protein